MALEEGGAIKWTFYEPEMDGLVFTNNSAAQYGDNIASVAKNMLIVIDSFT